MCIHASFSHQHFGPAGRLSKMKNLCFGIQQSQIRFHFFPLRRSSPFNATKPANETAELILKPSNSALYLHYPFLTHPQHLFTHPMQCRPLKLSLRSNRGGDVCYGAEHALMLLIITPAPNWVNARMPVYSARDDWDLQRVLDWRGGRVLDGLIERGMVRGQGALSLGAR